MVFLYLKHIYHIIPPMKLSTTTQYAIRVLSYMARDEHTLYSAKRLAEDLSIPYKYLTHLLTNLAKEGLVKAIHGRNGGFIFAKPLKDICLGHVIQAVEENDEGGCILGLGLCSSENKCALHDQWLHPKKLIDTMFHTTTLEDVKNQETGRLK